MCVSFNMCVCCCCCCLPSVALSPHLMPMHNTMLLCSLIHFIWANEWNRSHNVKFQLRGNVFFPNRNLENMHVCVHMSTHRLCESGAFVRKGFQYLYLDVGCSNTCGGTCNMCASVCEPLIRLRWLFRWSEFIYLLSSKFQTMPGASNQLKRQWYSSICVCYTDRFVIRMKRMVNILCHLSVVVLGSFW